MAGKVWDEQAVTVSEMVRKRGNDHHRPRPRPRRRAGRPRPDPVIEGLGQASVKDKGLDGAKLLDSARALLAKHAQGGVTARPDQGDREPCGARLIDRIERARRSPSSAAFCSSRVATDGDGKRRDPVRRSSAAAAFRAISSWCRSPPRWPPSAISALCQARRGNIFVDTFTGWLPKRLVQAAASMRLCGTSSTRLAMAVISWRLIVGRASSDRQSRHQ